MATRMAIMRSFDTQSLPYRAMKSLANLTKRYSQTISGDVLFKGPLDKPYTHPKSKIAEVHFR